MCQMTGARRVLEFGTLWGYSTIWFARAVGADRHVTTLEVDEQYGSSGQEHPVVVRHQGLEPRTR
ncbi:hypothetical protein VMT65_28445 [Nocardia sp. CDC153]|uniref:O-methyltransferase n=1 Tax=Nocardia sp. CDC153 TaxID=3112167 RepID=UPI002DB9D3F3|nr:hypothetical protein [Nocardia sp. CDC153]MEC3956999.1 hypothetical protein [Nocardia sp. CDC153]